MVKKGDFLAQIDPRPYQVALEQAEGQLAKDQALLKNAQLDLARYKTLVAQNSIAKQTRDTQTSLVAQDQATIMSDQAQIDTQKLNLAYCHIVAPVAGRVGLRQVDAGNYVQTSDANGIVVVTQLQPISVIFTLPEDNLRQVLKQLARRRHAAGRRPTTAPARPSSPPASWRRSTTRSTPPPARSSCARSSTTRPEILFPNQFVNIRLLVDTLHERDDRAERGDPARRARHLRLSGQARQHGGGAEGQARPDRRPARR